MFLVLFSFIFLYFEVVFSKTMCAFYHARPTGQEISGNTRGKRNDIFRLSEYSYQNKWATSRGDPEYSGRKKAKRTCPFEFQPKFTESLHNRSTLFLYPHLLEMRLVIPNSALRASLPSHIQRGLME